MKLWGEDVVLAMTTRAVIVQFQASVRNHLGRANDNRLNDKQIIEAHNQFKPEVGRETLSGAEKAYKFIKTIKLSKGELIKLLEDMKWDVKP